MNLAFKDEFIKLASKADNKNTAKSLASGFVAGAISSTVMSPLSTILDTMRSGGKGSHKSFSQTAKNLYHEGGIPRFYRGLGASALKLGLGMGITFGVAEFLKQKMNDQENKKLLKNYNATK